MYNNGGDKKSPYMKNNKVASIITQFDSNTTPVKDHTSSDLSLLFEVVKEFNARLGDELDLRIGQKIQVISDDSEYNDGWYMGKNLDTGNVGLYPKSFTQIIPNSNGNNAASSPFARPSLLRSRSRRLNSPSSQQNSPITPSAQAGSNFQHSPIAGIGALHAANSQVSGLGMHNNNSTISSAIDSPLPKKSLDAIDQSTRQSSVHNSTIKDIDKALAELTSVGNDLIPSQVATWTPEQVSSYFSSIGVDMESAGQFARHKITGSILLELELSHLKELDISSFGTRFEIFKAIETLKIESKNNDLDDSETNSTSQRGSLMPPPPVNRSGTAPLKGHQRKRSQSLDELPVTSTEDKNIIETPSQPTKSRNPSSEQRHSRQASYNFKAPVESLPVPPKPPHQLNNLSSSSSSSSGSLQQQLGDQAFMSPRKAPAPPIEAQKQTHNFKFGSGSANENGLTAQFSRLSTLPEKERAYSSTSRPTSSVYHSRSSSIPLNNFSPTRGHKHTNSIANKEKNAHKRHSSVFSFISGGGSINAGNDPYKAPSPSSRRNSLVNLLSSPSKISLLKKKEVNELDDEGDDDLTDLSPVDNAKKTTPKKQDAKSPSRSSPLTSPFRRSVSALVSSPQQEVSVPQKRAISEASRMKSLRNASTSHLQNFTRSKTKTSAFKEGIQFVSPDDAIKTADHYGWMYKKGSLNFKKRYFTLHGTRLSYFQSLKDTHERGLIDIQAHKVLPTDANDLKSVLASSTTAGRYSFKLLPPAPGSKKGLTFTQPKVHYFAVSSKEEMRGWMASLMKATIDMDETVPVVSSYTSATVSLKQAQVMQQKSSERAMKFIKNGIPVEDETFSSSDTANTTFETPKMQQQSRMSSRYSNKNDNSEYDDFSNTMGTSVDGNDSSGFDSPYLLASGLLSPKSPKPNHSEDINNLSNGGAIHKPSGVQRTKTFGTNPVPMITNLENGTTSNSSAAAIAAANAATNGSFKRKANN